MSETTKHIRQWGLSH